MSEVPSNPQRVPEAFGQLGVRQFLIPAISLVLLFLSCFSAVMWSRSYDTSDVLTRRSGNTTWQVYSIFGRLIVARTDYRIALDPGSSAETGWQYSSLPVPDGIRDNWISSWKKTVGVEWRAEPLSKRAIVAAGWWMRVQWRTVTLLTVIMPLARAILYHRRSRRRQRGFHPIVAGKPAEQQTQTNGV